MPESKKREHQSFSESNIIEVIGNLLKSTLIGILVNIYS